MNLVGIGVPRLANTGGPMSRTRKERIASTLLGADDGAIRCPRIVRVGINFPNEDPVNLLTDILEKEGFSDPEELRGAFQLPENRLVARPYTRERGVVDVYRDERRDILWNALVLGLCTAQLYDPARPVLWTQAAVTRRLELFDPAGFYA